MEPPVPGWEPWGDGRIIATGKGCYNGKREVLNAAAQAGDKWLREVGPAHLFLGCRDVVGDAVVANGVEVTVEDGVVGRGIAIARLADTAGINKKRLGAKLDGYAGREFQELAGQVIWVDAA